MGNPTPPKEVIKKFELIANEAAIQHHENGLSVFARCYGAAYTALLDQWREQQVKEGGWIDCEKGQPVFNDHYDVQYRNGQSGRNSWIDGNWGFMHSQIIRWYKVPPAPPLPNSEKKD